MSTFGKKAIKYWDYQYTEDKAMTFNKTPIETQLEILEKWFPIGMTCVKYDRFFKKYDDTKYEIVGYDKIGGGTIHQLKLIKILNIHDKEYHERVTIHPVFFKPTDEYLKMMNRENKLNNLELRSLFLNMYQNVGVYTS